MKEILEKKKDIKKNNNEKRDREIHKDRDQLETTNNNKKANK